MDKNNKFFEIQNWLTTKEAALYLGISENAFRVRVSRYKVPKYKLGKRSVRFKVSDLNSMLMICKTNKGN